MFFEKIINTAFLFGAAVVIFGAWAKLEHKEFSDTALTTGMLLETAIFCIYGIMEWKKKTSTQENDQLTPSRETNMDDLTTTMKHTNKILNKVFKTEE